MLEKILAYVVDSFPIVLAVIGIVISYHSPRSKAGKIKITVILIVAGISGFLAQSYLRSRSENAHKEEVTELKGKMAELLKDATMANAKLDALKLRSEATIHLATSGSAKQSSAETPGQKEIARRQKILSSLRNEYILSHDNISPAIMSGIQSPPADWLNQRLNAIGEKWTVSEPYPTPALPVEVRCEIAISDCPDQQIRNKTLQMANALDEIYNKYAEYLKRPVKSGQERAHELQLSTMRSMILLQYRGEASQNVAKYRNEIVRRLHLEGEATKSDYLYDLKRDYSVDDFQEVARDLRSLALQLKEPAHKSTAVK